jgi:hypothetical protein
MLGLKALLMRHDELKGTSNEKYNLTVSLHTPYCADVWPEGTSDEPRRAKRYNKMCLVAGVLDMRMLHKLEGDTNLCTLYLQ